MKRLFDILSLFKEYFLLATLILASLVLLALNDNAQIRAIRSFTVGAIGYSQDILGFIPNYFDLQHENRVLREQNLNLSEEVSRLREARLENLRLRKLLELKERASYGYRSANVVGKNLQLFRNTITIDAGENDGVRTNMPVVTEAGLVGRVASTSGGYSVVQLMTHRDFRASGKTQRGRVDGIVTWRGGDNLSLKNVARTLDIRPGDVVLTSEYSSMFPPGIKIGIVSNTSQEPGALFQTVEIVPSVDFSRLEEVFVIRQVPDSSRLALEEQAPE